MLFQEIGQYSLSYTFINDSGDSFFSPLFIDTIHYSIADFLRKYSIVVQRTACLHELLIVADVDVYDKDSQFQCRGLFRHFIQIRELILKTILHRI